MDCNYFVFKFLNTCIHNMNDFVFKFLKSCITILQTICILQFPVKCVQFFVRDIKCDAPNHWIGSSTGSELISIFRPSTSVLSAPEPPPSPNSQRVSKPKAEVQHVKA